MRYCLQSKQASQQRSNYFCTAGAGAEESAGTGAFGAEGAFGAAKTGAFGAEGAAGAAF